MVVKLDSVYSLPPPSCSHVDYQGVLLPFPPSLSTPRAINPLDRISIINPEKGGEKV